MSGRKAETDAGAQRRVRAHYSWERLGLGRRGKRSLGISRGEIGDSRTDDV
jgi:hypothetical protein